MSVTDNWTPRHDTKESAHRIGMEIETAVATDNLHQDRVAMNHATDYMTSHPEQQDIFKYEVEAKLGRDGATAAVVDFELVHADTGAGATISKKQISDAKFSPLTNPLQKDLLNAAEGNYDQLPPYFWSLSLTNASMSKIRDRLQSEQQSLLPGNQVRNFFERDNQGNSLYDRVKDENGNIKYGAVADLQNRSLDQGQRDVLSYIDKYQSNRYYLFGSRGMTKDDLASVVESHNMNLDELTRTRQQQLAQTQNTDVPIP
ncbi:MAG: hypothetical protein U0103_28260 [Candidatus Obscuribacterales bacterium]